MAKIIVECADPNDLQSVEAATEQFQGKCNVTYFKQAQAMVEAGTAKTLHSASNKIARDTGETPKSVEHRVYRGKKKLPQLGEHQESSMESKTLGMGKPQTDGDIPKCKCGAPREKNISRHGTLSHRQTCAACRKKKWKEKLREKEDQIKEIQNRSSKQIKKEIGVWNNLPHQLNKINHRIKASCFFPPSRPIQKKVISAASTEINELTTMLNEIRKENEYGKKTEKNDEGNGKRTN